MEQIKNRIIKKAKETILIKEYIKTIKFDENNNIILSTDTFDGLQNENNYTILLNKNDCDIKIENKVYTVNDNDVFNETNVYSQDNNMISFNQVNDVYNYLFKILSLEDSYQIEFNILQNKIDECNNILNIFNNLDSIKKTIKTLKNKISIEQDNINAIKINPNNEEINELTIELTKLSKNNSTSSLKKPQYDIDKIKKMVHDAQNKLKTDPNNEDHLKIINKYKIIIKDYEKYYCENKNNLEINNKIKDIQNKINILNEQNDISHLENYLIELNEELQQNNNKIFKIENIIESEISSKSTKLNVTLKKIKKNSFKESLVDILLNDLVSKEKTMMCICRY
jgi:hypothetical protein